VKPIEEFVVVNELASFSRPQVREPRPVPSFVGTPLDHRAELHPRDAAEWCRKQVTRFKMRNFTIPTEISIEPSSRYGLVYSVILRITIQILDRQTGQPGPLTQLEEIPAPWQLSPTMFVDIVYNAIERLMIHEAREAFHVDGERVFDPHVGERGYVHESAPPEPPRWATMTSDAPGSLRKAPDRPPLRWQDLALPDPIEGSIGGMRFRAKTVSFAEGPSKEPGDEKP
jgi:hypothetical protein